MGAESDPGKHHPIKYNTTEAEGRVLRALKGYCGVNVNGALDADICWVKMIYAVTRQ